MRHYADICDFFAKSHQIPVFDRPKRPAMSVPSSSSLVLDSNKQGRDIKNDRSIN
jgi:hypothetical protein